MSRSVNVQQLSNQDIDIGMVTLMDTNSLKNTLKAVHENLLSTNSVDPELKDLLQTLDRDIQQLLEQNGHDAERKASLVERAQAISAKLAIQHPHVEPALREVADMLANMGI